MPVTSPKQKPTAKEVLSVVRQMTQSEQERLLSAMFRARRRRRPQTLSQAESELLLKINQAVPDKLTQRYTKLITKRQKGIITAEELREHCQLTDQVESADADSLKHLIELAKLRKQPLEVVMRDLEIPARKHA